MRDRYPLELLSPKRVDGQDVLRGHSRQPQVLRFKGRKQGVAEATLGDWKEP